MMYSICQTTHPTTTIEHSVECHFYNLDEKNLVVAGSNQLSVYKIEAKLLEFCQSFELYGTVASLQKVGLGSRQSRSRDSLVISFHDAKLSIVEYNPETHDLKTISMHYFEDDDLRSGYVTNHINPPVLRVDPEDRCIAMLIYGRHIVIIPLDKDEEELEVELYNSSSASSPMSTHDDDPLEVKSNSKPRLNNNREDSGDEHMMSIDKDIDNFDKQALGQVVKLRPAHTSFKSPVLPSYKVDLSPEICGEKIEHITDIQFLFNYNDPTLVLLFEPIQTWSGRVAARQDTFSIVALSMNLHQRIQPIIWTVNKLPYDCLQILPVPKPIGGLLVVACNELIYLNQSVPQFGMSFNSFSKDSSTFPFHEAKKENGDKVDYINISLDLSQAVFLNHNKILFILKDGDVYLVTLFNDDMRSIKNFHFERIASTVQPNCLTLCENNLLFIGSHVGDSVLAEIVGDLRSDNDNLDAYDDDTDSLMSTEEREPVSLFEHDQLISTSASGKICYGEATNLCDSLRHDYKDPYVELIMTSGHNKDGSICVMQKTLKPDIEDTYELRLCGDLWAIKPSKFGEPTGSRLLLNRDNETMVFSTIGELKELKKEGSPFRTNEPSIFASNIGSDNLTIQVMSSCAQLISDNRLIDSVKIGGKICDVCFADPHLVVLTKDGNMYHIQLRLISNDMQNGVSHDDDSPAGSAHNQQYNLSCQEIGSLTNGKVLSFDLYKDVSGLFTCNSDDSLDSMDYRDIEQTYWLLIVDDRGVLEIFNLSNFNLVYSIDNLPAAPSVLSDNIKLFVTDIDSTAPKTKEILMVGLGRHDKKALLFVRSEAELYIYETYRFPSIDIKNHLKLRFKKISTTLLHTIIPPEYELECNQKPLAITDGYSNSNNVNSKSSSSSRSRHMPNLRERWLQKKRWLREFRNIGGYNGVFLAGFKPHWFVMTDRCQLRSHPMNVEGAIYAFSQYDNDSFIYFNEHRELRIAKLPKQLNLDSDWLIHKVHLKETVSFVNYHVERKIYCVVTSRPVSCLKIMKVGNEPDTMKIEDLERECGYIPPTSERFRLKLYDSQTWSEIPDCEIEFEEWEQVTCVKNVSLVSEGTTSGLKGYIAISTNYCYGEDVPNRGRIWILDLIEVVPEPDRPLTKNKIKKVYCQEQKGPVTSLSCTCGLLMSAVGQKIYLWQLKENQLDGVAFIDTQIYIHCAASVKNLILVSDVCKSVSLLRYQQDTRTLSMVCRDVKPLEVFACDFLIDNESLSFVVADSEMNIMIYAHDPENEDSHGGTRLLRQADFHLGAHVTSFSRLRAKVPSVFVGDPNEEHYSRRKHMTMFCTVDGSVGLLFPIHESIYQEFMQLQNEMTVAQPHVAGLNPRTWRCVKQARPTLASPCKGIVDGDLIRRFLSLSIKERNDLTRKCGTTTEKILADIQIVHESTMYF